VNNIYLKGIRIAAVIPRGNTGYYLTDQIDGIKVVVDGFGMPVCRFEYLIFGEEWVSEAVSAHPCFQRADSQWSVKYYRQNQICFIILSISSGNKGKIYVRFNCKRRSKIND